MGIKQIGLRQIGIKGPFGTGKSWSSYWTTRTISGLAITVDSDTQLTLNWTNNGTQDWTGTKVYISTDDVTYTLNKTIASIGTSTTVTGLTADTFYYVKVAPYKNTNVGSYSNTDIAITTLNNAPTNVTANPTTGGVLITWTDVEATSGDVHIFASIDGGAWEELATVAYTVQTYTHLITGSHVIQYKLYQEIVALPFEEEYDAVLAQFTTKPSAEVQAAQNTLVKTLVDDGVWASAIDGLWLFSGHTNDASESLINWKNPSAEKATLVNAPTFTANRGFTGEVAASRCIDLKWNGKDDGVHFTLNSASVLIGCYTTGAVGSLFGSGYWQDSYTKMNYSTTGGVNNASAGSLGNSNAATKAYYSFIRSASDVIKWYKNKEAAVDGTAASGTAVCRYDWRVLAAATGTSSQETYSDGTVSVFVVGNFNATQKNTIIDALEVYMDYIGNSLM